MKINFRKLCPIYISTLNIFRPLHTWWHNRMSYSPPHIKVSFSKTDFNYLYNNFYTWYWWETAFIWDFFKKSVIILIDDVFWKSTYGIVQYQQSPFILVRIFNYNMIIRFVAPNNMSNTEYWEKMIRKITK